ncbi:sulfatase [Rubinisphaera sp. JC750]|uniref:sulfatase family protein n=1 Tax=Rubinisphaera sp. JC750 TaxID=2898658 RepID=UPI001F321857|nr:sulfatase [Rubinisphaera sp. JC750]
MSLRFNAFVFCLLLTAVPGRAADRPNILFIFTDDHANHAISCYGSQINETPNLDRIANEGMRFDNCFCTNSICGPSRAVILTGKYSHKNGFYRNGNKFNGGQQTFPKLLQKAGYQTAMIGKWHLGEHMHPTGFNYSEVLVGQGTYYNPVMLKDPNGDGNRERISHTGYTTDIITDLALDWLKEGRDADKPFMMMFQHKAPHREWAPGPDHLTMYDGETIPEPDNLFDDYEGRGTAAKTQDMSIAKTMTARDLKFTVPPYMNEEQKKVWNEAYDPKNKAFKEANLTGDDLIRWKYQRYIKDYLRCIASVDDNVGRMLQYLEDNGLAENTVVIYSSDQGFYLGDHGWFDKRFMYEESYRQPLMVRWPNVVKPGSVNKDLVSNVDFAETFLDIANVEIPSDMQGASLVPLLKGHTPEDWREAHYYQYYEFEADRRTAHMVRRHRGVRTDRYKLIDFYNLGEWELYDLENDPREMRSVYGDPEYAQVQKDLKAKLEKLAEELEVPDDRGSVPKNPPILQRQNKQQPPPQKKPAQKKRAS